MPVHRVDDQHILLTGVSSRVPVLVNFSLRDTNVEGLPGAAPIWSTADAPPLRHRGRPPPPVLPVENPGGADPAPPCGQHTQYLFWIGLVNCLAGRK
jgi:hypothetical protein